MIACSAAGAAGAAGVVRVGESPIQATRPASSQATSGNPIVPGWYADPDGVVCGRTFWVFPTYSARYASQTFFDAFSSTDLVRWTRHEKVLTGGPSGSVKWLRRAAWAPSVVENGGRYYFFFSGNDIQNDGESGGIGVAVADQPQGPYADHLGSPLIDRFHNGAQPIDQFVFKDIDGQWYIVYGGWRHCNIAKLSPDFKSVMPFSDGSIFREITPKHYVEGPYMLRRGSKYYLMWSEGGWTGPDYCVAYAMADSVTGPFERIGKILQQDPTIATGAGHHSVIRLPRRGQAPDEYVIVYHRRPLGDMDGNHRAVCMDKMEFDADGRIKPVKITFEGVDRFNPD